MPRPTEGRGRLPRPLSKTGARSVLESLRSRLFVLFVLFAAFSGLVSPASAQTPSNTASLSALALSPATLSPAFASGTTMYTASVGYTVTRVSVTATKSDDNATVSYLDASDQPLADADTAEGHQVDLSVGDTVVKVKVTAQDTTTTETYTVTIMRTVQDTSLSPSASDPVSAHASTAEYSVTFRGAWTRAVTPDGVPAGAHFSRLVGGVHNADVSFLESGGTASAGVEAMAEVGGWTGLRDEVLAAVPDALASLNGTTDNISPTSSKSLTATLTTEHPRVTLVTMIAPSHDWFVGVSGLPLLNSEGRWLGSHEVSLYPWDAGTEEGSDFSLRPSVATDPQGIIESLRGTGPFTTEPIATLSFTLQSAVTTRSVAENTAAGTDIGAPVGIAGTSGTVNYTLGGTDAASFDIVAATGQLQTKAALDHETNSSYEVTVTATDSDGTTDTTVTIEVTNVAELASAVTGAASVNHAENDAGRVATYTASSAQDRDDIEWSLSGDDAAHFSIDDPAGALRFHIDPVSPNLFTKPPDYESPADNDTDNEYTVTLTASLPGSNTTVTKNVSVTVTDTDEAGTLTLSSTRPQMGTALTTALSDPDSVTGTPTYVWERSIRPNAWAVIAGATSGTYTPTAADTGTFLRATATYEDRHASGKSATALTYEVVTASLLTGLQATTNDSTANPDHALHPAFSADVLHYAVGCAASGDTMTVTPTAASGVRIAVNGTQTASGTAATVPVNRGSDVHITLTTADGAATTYVVHCHIHRERMLETTKNPRADSILEELIMLRFYDSVAIIDNNAVPRFRRAPGHSIWAYFRVDRAAVADQQQGDELEYRYSYVNTAAWPHFEFTVLDQSLELLETGITTVAPLETIDLHDFRVLPNGNYLLLAYEPAERDLSDLPFDHPDIEETQPQAVRDAAVQIITPAGEEVFTWNSGGITPLEDCTQHRFAADEHHSYAHINSLQMVDGLIIASLRGCSKVLALDPDHAEDHKVAWRVGRSNLTAEQWEDRDVGPAPLAVVGDPAGEFCAQHAAQILPNGNLILFDNGVHCVVNPWTGEFIGRADDDYYSRAVEYALDHDNGEAVFVRDHSLRGARQYIGNSQGQVEPLSNGDWLISWGRASRSVALDDPEVPIEAVTQVDPDTGEEKFSLSEPDSPLTNFRAIPVHPVALFAVPEPLAAVFPVRSHTSLGTRGPADRPKVVVAFNQPVVDPVAATASVSVEGATVTGVSPHVVAGEAANTYIFTLTPTGFGAITFSLVADQPCGSGDSGGVCTADGRTLWEVPTAYVIAGAPQFASDESGARSVAENTPAGRDIGSPVAATDPDGATVAYSLGGADAGLFGIVTATGQLRTAAALDHETRDSYTVAVIAANPSGVSTAIDIVITVEDVNEVPVVSPVLPGGTVLSFAENKPTTETVGAFTAVDHDDGDTADDWSLSGSGSDASLFSIDGGVLRFLTAPDFESKVDAQGRHVYALVVEASDGDLTGTLAVSVNVSNVNEAPEIDGPNTATVTEGSSGVDWEYTATDPEGADVGWRLLGADEAFFEISDGDLSFKEPPDFEARADANGDNVYEVEVEASDGDLAASIAMSVTVDNAEETGAVSLSAVQPQAGVAVTASLSDPDEVVGSSVTWQWYGSPNKQQWTEIGTAVSGAVSSSYTPSDGDVGRYLRAVASYSDGHGSAKSAQAESQHRVLAAPVTNQPPTFASGTVTRSVAEDAAVGSAVGDAVTANDPENDTLAYSMSPTVGVPFEIVPETGQLLTTGTLDHETANSYTLTVRAEDPSGASDTKTVQVEVSDVNEPPVVSGGAVVRFTENETGDVATFTATDPDIGDTVSWDLGGPDAALFTVGGGVLSFKKPPDYDKQASRDRDNSYAVVVKATDDGGSEGTLSVAVNVDDVNEAPTITGPAEVSVPAQRRAVATYTADDPENVTVGWSLGGPDADLFSLDGGVLSFKNPPDFDGADPGDNEHHVTVEATDGVNTSRLAVTVTVTDASEVRPQPSSGGGFSGTSGSSGGGGGGGDFDVGVATFVVANGWSAADVGAASVLAARTSGAVVLYTAGDELSEQTRALLREALPAEVIIVGGTAAVSRDVRTQIRAASSESGISRITGEGRSDTAAATARRILGAPSTAGRVTLVVANGWSPPDIGAATALAARSGRAAVLYTQHDVLPEATAALLADYQVARVILIGGTAAISSQVHDAIAAAAGGDASISRLTGADRVATAAQTARRVLGNPAAAPDGITLVIANGWSAPDVGVAAALAAATENSAVAYTAQGTLPEATAALIRDYRAGQVIIVGGRATVSNDVRTAITQTAPDSADIRRITGSTRTETAARAARRTLANL